MEENHSILINQGKPLVCIGRNRHLPELKPTEALGFVATYLVCRVTLCQGEQLLAAFNHLKPLALDEQYTGIRPTDI